ncbi:MAG: guanylate kinase [Pseudomonadota bacterium]|nr:guanylate kinase [Pseudomonadota bacterium]MEC8036911.1 guanylate kinase [Pseudomonadota bacterium]MEC8153293.1 guanylate kinase [Pseudomonadota bacterium]MEC8274588.1 guanylate kinase [Pseudomonadota bacterium]
MSNDALPRRGLMLVLSSPSGAGKTTISRALLDGDDALELSVSATTRAPREGEVDGVHYHFISDDRFRALIDEDGLLEWANVFNNAYGTPRAAIEKALSEGRDVLFDIDWQGTQQLRQKMPKDLVSVFVLPPSLAALETRLKSRQQMTGETDEQVAYRLSKAPAEVSHWAEYDFIIVNSDIEQSVAQVRAILTAERLRRERLRGIEGIVTDIRSIED